jgi:hypothetical protein
MPVPSRNLKRLIDALAPYWAAESLIVRAYFKSPQRSRQSDILWLARQCRKEFWDGFDEANPGLFIGPLQKMLNLAAKIDQGVDRHEILDMTEGLHAEFAHYCAFADAYDAIRDKSDPPINPIMLRDVKSWPENEVLGELRAGHIRAHGDIGMRASRLTEGGYCALFSEGAKLKGGSAADQAIARACRSVYDDEFGHMLKGIVGLDSEKHASADWNLLRDLAVEQMRARLHMRNAQFGNALPSAEIERLKQGRSKPVAFNYAKAGLAA